jgi:nitroimidazol reductase NimA-like FMN-containing flavoprotein (pyridoxamine 5'-phosphate oxidase superfamily)
MVIEDITEQDCRRLLTGVSVVARLACARENQPYVVPIHVHLDDEYLYSYATQGQKVEWMRQNPLVCLELDELITQTEWVSVVVFGEYEELEDTPARAEARQIAEALFQKSPMWWEPAAVPVGAEPPRFPVVFRIRIVRMTGRRATADGHGPGEPGKKPPGRLGGVLRRLARES